MQKWKKLGQLFQNDAYAAVPVLMPLSEHIARVYFSSRDEKNQSVPWFLDLDLRTFECLNTQKISVPAGRLGMFDENGIMPTSVLKKNNEVWLYYIGWNLGHSVPFRNAVGLMISKDGGTTFEKFSEGPILDRSIHDKCFVASNCVFAEADYYRMFYLSCDEWKYVDGVLQHSYKIKYTESADAIHWDIKGQVAIDFMYPNEYAISVPRVLKEHDIYKMWYSFRGGPIADTYRIGYAESSDGVHWNRKDENIILDVSANGWDSEMICYPCIFNYNGKRYLLYNGNGYGKTGFGLAVLQE